MSKILSSAIAVIVLALGVHAQTNPAAAPAASELTSLLNEFLAGASRNDAAVHDRFWAEDVIYTLPLPHPPARPHLAPGHFSIH